MARLALRPGGDGAGVDDADVSLGRVAHDGVACRREPAGHCLDLALIQAAAEAVQVDVHPSTYPRLLRCSFTISISPGINCCFTDILAKRWI
jgi:hypothetical protein